MTLWGQNLLAFFLDPNGPFGINQDILVNLVSDGFFALLSALFTVLIINTYIRYVDYKSWLKSRQSFGRRFIYSHRTMLRHYVFLLDVIERGELDKIDQARFRNNLKEMRQALEQHILQFSYVINPKIAQAVEEYRQTFSYIVGISRTLSSGQPATVRWRAPSATPEHIFSYAQSCILNLWKHCHLDGEVPQADKKELFEAARHLDLGFSKLISIEKYQAGYFREKDNGYDHEKLWISGGVED